MDGVEGAGETESYVNNCTSKPTAKKNSTRQACAVYVEAGVWPTVCLWWRGLWVGCSNSWRRLAWTSWCRWVVGVVVVVRVVDVREGGLLRWLRRVPLVPLG